MKRGNKTRIRSKRMFKTENGQCVYIFEQKMCMYLCVCVFIAAAQAEYTSSEKSAMGLECSVKNFNFILKSMGTQ